MTLRSSDLQSDGDLDSIRNSCDIYAKKVWLKPAGETKIGRGRSSNSSKDDLSVVLGEFDLNTQSDEFDINR